MSDTETRFEDEADDGREQVAPERPTLPAGGSLDAQSERGGPGSILDTGALLGGGGQEAAQPERIGPYRILGVLGEGGMGVVYRAFQEEPVKRPVALKLIKAGRDTREIVARFESERQALALMTHPGIAQIYDGGTTADHRPYFVMEFVEGTPLSAYCARKNLDTRRRLELFVKVCDAIQHAHQKAVIHRDLKPSNILVSEVDGEPLPKVIDFGIAKAVKERLTESTLQTQVGQIMGTLEYMSPEQTGFDDTDIDTRTDVYSLGVILYELVTDMLPFDSARIRKEGLAGFLQMICEEDPPKPSTRITQAPPAAPAADGRRRAATTSRLKAVRGDIDWITLKALEKDRSRRYSSVSELAADVRRHLATEPILARPPSTVYRLMKFARRHRGRMIALAAVFVVSCGFVAGSWLRAHHRTRESLAQGEARLDEYATARVDKSKYEDWMRLRDQHDELEPVWEREDEIAARDLWEAHLRGLNRQFESTRTLLASALELAPWRSGLERPIKEALERLEVELLRQVRDQGYVRLGEADVIQRIHSLGVGRFAAEIEGGGKVLVTSAPAGAKVYCFRYELHDETLVPVPFRPAGASVAGDAPSPGPFLRIETVYEPERSPFRAGDRFLAVRGRGVRTRTELIRSLRGVLGKDSVTVQVERDGERIDLDWVPFPTFAPGVPGVPANTILRSFRFTFEGYPLDLGAAAALGSTGDRPLALDLPGGSYVLVLTKPGYVTTRFPVAMPEDDGDHEVRLVRNDDVPPGFLYVPAGRFTAGGDEQAYRSLPRSRDARTDAFLMARSEVTLGDYLEFLNSTDLPIAVDGRDAYRCRVDALKALNDLEGLSEVVGRLQVEAEYLIPIGRDQRGNRRILCARKEGRWVLDESPDLRLHPDLPVIGVSLIAALEYCRWLSEFHGGRWRFRLPRSGEWEKAARGVDARPYVWGDHLFWTFCTLRLFLSVDLFPRDESVFGIRGLAGSVAEYTGEQVPGTNMYIVRGGFFDVTDERDFRVASRDQALPRSQWSHIGFRVVADLPARED